MKARKRRTNDGWSGEFTSGSITESQLPSSACGIKIGIFEVESVRFGGKPLARVRGTRQPPRLQRDLSSGDGGGDLLGQ